jgi:peptidoglycan/LPS O-acetylase OafA/YrhL
MAASHGGFVQPVGWLWLGVLVLVTLVASASFFVLVERPCMDPTWVRRVVSHGRERLRRHEPAIEVVVTTPDPGATAPV